MASAVARSAEARSRWIGSPHTRYCLDCKVRLAEDRERIVAAASGPEVVMKIVTRIPPGRPEDGPEETGEARGSGWLSLPDRLTRFRLASVPVLWILALAGEAPWLGVGVMVAALTDVVDGPIARRLRRSTARGSRLDSIADHALTASTGAWIVLLRPEFVVEQLALLIAWAALGGSALLVGWVRFRRIGDLHLYSAKAAGTLGYLFAIWLLLFGTYSVWVFRVVVAICILASLETLLVVSTRSTVDEHLRSILLPPRRGAESPSTEEVA